MQLARRFAGETQMNEKNIAEGSILPKLGVLGQILARHKGLLAIIVNSLFVLSGTVLTITLSIRQIDLFLRATGDRKDFTVFVISAIALLSFLGLGALAFKFQFLEKMFAGLLKKPLFVNALLLLFAMLCAWMFVRRMYLQTYYHALALGQLQDYPNWWYALLYVRGIVADPLLHIPQWIFTAMFLFFVSLFYLFIALSFADMIGNMFATATKGEKLVLLFGSLVSVLLVVVSYCLSNLYWSPVLRGTEEIIPYDSLYQYDSGLRVIYYVFTGTLETNEIRHPLFSIFSLPIGALARLVSGESLVNSIAIQSVQMIMLVCAAIMLSRMVATENNKQKYLFILLFFLSFPILVGCIPLERNILTPLLLIFAMYERFNNRSAAIWVNGAIGTNAVFFPAAVFYIKSKKTIVKDLLLGGCSFLLMLLATGMMAIFIDYKEQLADSFERLTHKATWSERLYYYMAFAQSCVFSPKSRSFVSEQGAVFKMDSSNFERLSLIGLLIFIVALYGFARNTKNKFAQISFVWVMVSFLLMGVGGWAIAQRDTVFYTSFFSWAYLSLIYLAIDKTFGHKGKIVALALLVASCLIVNGMTAINILRFGMEYYPIVWH
jgi:hypothetical protein